MSHALHRLGATALAATTLSAGLGVAVVASPTHAAQGVSSLAQVDCIDSSRMVQLRSDGTELWMSSMSKADADNPTVYAWTKIYSLPQSRPGLAVAVLSTHDDMVRMLMTDAEGGLRSYTWDALARTMVTKELTPDAADKKYDFRRLTYDGTRLYGNKGTDLYVMTSPSTTEAPHAMAKISGYTGYARSFFGNAGTPDGELSWTGSDGKLRIGDIQTSPAGWVLEARAVADRAFPEHTITSPGGGILLRDLPTGALWRHHLDTDASTSSAPTSLASATGAPDLPISTDPTTCRKAATQSDAPPANPYPAEMGTAPYLTDRAEFVFDQMVEYHPGVRCDVSAYRPGQTTDHNSGNAIDCFPGTFGRMPTASEKAEGDAAAAWLVTYASTLKVQYVIWYGKIWNISRASEGWRPYTAATDVTGGHYDHVHVSVTAPVQN